MKIREERNPMREKFKTERGKSAGGFRRSESAKHFAQDSRRLQFILFLLAVEGDFWQGQLHLG